MVKQYKPEQKIAPEVVMPGRVEGKPVPNILLDTRCSRTVIQKDLIAPEKLLQEEAVAIQCAHGDIVLYLLAKVEMEIGGKTIKCCSISIQDFANAVLFGTDLPELNALLRSSLEEQQAVGIGSAMIVTTRAKAKQQQEDEPTHKQE